MWRYLRPSSVVLFLSLVSPSSANAGDPYDTKYTYYLIAGQSADDLHSSMSQKGPHIYGGRAYASATVDPTVTLRTRQQGGICRIADFRVHMKFTIRLPKLKKSANLTSELRESFQQFYQSAKQHEETHRSIWLKCARETEVLARKVRAGTCSEAEAMAYDLYHHIGQECHERQMAFEAIEYERLAQHPFIRLLSKNPMPKAD
jgi:predicted secreted Zn-dependent protease